MLLQKLTVNHVIVFIVSLLLLGLLLNSGMVIIQAIQLERSIDESQTVSTSPVLQKQLLRKAVTILEDQEKSKTIIPMTTGTNSAMPK